MNAPIVEAIAQIIREKKIEREVFQDIIQSVFLAMIKKKYGTSDNFDVIFNLDKGDIEIFCERTVVSDEEFEDDDLRLEPELDETNDPEDDEEQAEYDKGWYGESLKEAASPIIERIEEWKKIGCSYLASLIDETVKKAKESAAQRSATLRESWP